MEGIKVEELKNKTKWNKQNQEWQKGNFHFRYHVSWKMYFVRIETDPRGGSCVYKMALSHAGRCLSDEPLWKL